MKRREIGLLWLLLAALLAAAIACQQPVTPLPTTPVPSPPAAATRPPATATRTPTLTPAAPTPTPTPDKVVAAHQLYLPLVSKPAGPTPTATPTPSPTVPPPPTHTPTPTPYPTVDFAAVRANLQASGRELAFVKTGFHLSIGGNQQGLGEWMRRLDEAGVPFFLKSVGYAGPLYEAQELIKASGVPHVLVYRSSGDVPNYDLPPTEAARLHWEMHRGLFPPELDREIVWVETVNEVDKNRSEWLAQFAQATAQLTLAEGFRWAAFGWSAGEPELQHWSAPHMLAFLRLMAQHPDRLAIALHEYSFTGENIAFEYPYRVGHFLHLFQVCDQYGIPRPTVLITEWGWEYNQVPSAGKAMQDVAWASALYAPFPQVKGTAIWHLGGGDSFGNIAQQAQKFIRPLTRYSLTNYFVAPALPALAPADPELYRP